MDLGDQVNSDLKKDFPLFIAVLNGSFMFASDLIRRFHHPCEVTFIKLFSYAGIGRNQDVMELIGLYENIAGRNVVILEDIVDSGNTLKKIVEILQEKKAQSVRVASFLKKNKTSFFKGTIDYFGYPIDDKFVVGYGMDYNGLGRNLPHIYQLIK